MKNWSLGAVAVLALALGVVLTQGWRTGAAERAEGGAAAGSPAYSVVMTDGSHIIVTDNKANKLYFYAIGQDEKIGDPLHLRGSVDLTEVGKPVITPTTYKKK